jgi:phosphohistidine phosphatase
MKELFILRHAEAVSAKYNTADFDRQLSNDGVVEARQLGEKCNKAHLLPSVIYSSSARRALTTAIIFAEETNFPQDKIVVLPKLYDLYPDQLMDIILETSDEFSKVMVVGHNPVLTVFLNIYTIEEIVNLPTGTLVQVEYPNNETWESIKESKGNIKAIWKPQW